MAGWLAVEEFSICDRGGQVLHDLATRTSGKVVVEGFEPGTEQIAGAYDE